jgi:hypothetical protein
MSSSSSNKILVTLSGYKGSGKDTVANILVKEYGFVRVALADHLKDTASQLFDVPRQNFDLRFYKDRIISRYPVRTTDSDASRIQSIVSRELELDYWTPRALVIALGSVVRAVDPNYWVRQVLDEVSGNERVVITDVRFKSELEFLQKYIKSTKLIAQVHRSDIYGDSLSASENDLSEFPFPHTISNNSDIENLQNEVHNFISSHINAPGMC